MTIALIGGTVIDGTGTDPQPGTTIVIEDTKIIELSRKTEFDRDVDVFDVPGKFIIPGIIDTHVHFSYWFQWLISEQKSPLSYMMCETALQMKRSLDSGVTTARDLGGMEVGFVDAQVHGVIPGPRMQTSCVIIQATNGLTDIMPGVGGAITPQGLTAFLPGLPSPWADGEDAVRAKVRECLRYGAHVIKIANSSVPWAKPHLNPDRALFTKRELEAAVDEAHRAGVKVCCHVVGYENTESTLDAIRAGVDLIDHGSLLDDECIEEMAKRNTWYCPMFSILDFHRARNPDPVANTVGKRCFDLTVESFQKAIKAGVRICMGTDAGAETGWQAHEMAIMAECGMTPMDVMVSSTKRGAEAMGLDHMVGTLEIGKEADLLVIDGNPLKDYRLLGKLENLILVMQAGKPVSGPLAYQFPYQVPDHLQFVNTVQPIKRSW
jgi:imidazolonepropionase-like amidohydrolase